MGIEVGNEVAGCQSGAGFAAVTAAERSGLT